MGLGVKIYNILEYFVCFFYFSFMDSFVFKQQAFFSVDFLSVTLDHRVQCPQGGARGQNLGHLKNYIFFLLLFSLI